jgi:hypothetical protein
MAFAEAAQCIPEFSPMALMNFSPKAFAEAAQCISEAAQCIAEFSPVTRSLLLRWTSAFLRRLSALLSSAR